MSDVKTMVFPEMGSNNGLETALLANGGGRDYFFDSPVYGPVFL